MKKVSLYIMAVLYFAAGINHFVHSDGYMKIMPAWLGWHRELVAVSGACECVFGLLLIPLRTRSLAAWCLIALLIAIFPANLQMTLNYTREHNPNTWLTILRLPLQLLLIWWAYIYTKPTNFSRKNNMHGRQKLPDEMPHK